MGKKHEETLEVALTEQEVRILNVLSDGKPHTVEELLKAMVDELSTKGALLVSICLIRKKLAPYNQYIHCIENRKGGGGPCYVHVVPRKIRLA